MIETTLMNIIRDNIDNMLVSKNYSTKNDNYIVVYDMGSDPININDETRTYQVVYHIEVASTDFNEAKRTAYNVYELMNNLKQVDIDIKETNINIKNATGIKLLRMIPERLPSRFGVEDDKMIYTLTYLAPLVVYC